MKPYFFEMTALKFVVAWAEDEGEAKKFALDDHFSSFTGEWEPMYCESMGELTEDQAASKIRHGALKSKP